MYCHFELLLSIREKDVQLWMKKLSGRRALSWSNNTWKWVDHCVDEAQVFVSKLGPGADWLQLLQKGCEFSSVLLPNRGNWQDLRQVWHWHYCTSPQYTLYGRVLSPEFMHANCNQIPTGSRTLQRAAVRLQDDKATSLLRRTISLITCCLNIFSAFSTMCRERTLAYCAA